MTTSEKTEQYLLQTYGRFPLTIVRGSGTKVWDDRGREYLDFCAGIATCSIGHCHPALSKAVADQAQKKKPPPHPYATPTTHACTRV